MATTLYFRNQTATAEVCRPLIEPLRLNGVAPSSMTSWMLSSSRGALAADYPFNTVDGPTNGVEAHGSSGPQHVYEWVTQALSADFTISGTVTFNLRGYESATGANAAINCLLQVIDSNLKVRATILKTARTTELGTGESAANFTGTPTSTVVHKGERIRVVIFADDAGTMASTFTWRFVFNGPTGGASGDSYITFTENLTFLDTAPTGTVIYPTENAVTGTAPFIDPDTKTWAFASDIGDWAPGAWAGYSAVANAVTHETTDGYGANGCLKIEFTSSPSDQGAIGTIMTWPGKLYGRVNYTMTFWVKTQSGSGALQWGFGSKSNDAYTGDEDVRERVINQTITTSWVQKTLSLSPTHDIEDPVFWFATYGAVTHTILVDDIVLTPNPGSTNVRNNEAWTSRGSGVVQGDGYDAAGPVGAAPFWKSYDIIRFVYHWTRPLQAVTLTGRVNVNVRGAYSGDCGIGVEIAVTDEDGSNAVIWGMGWVGVRLTTTESAGTAIVTADDLAITDGQRIRIRFLHDDGPLSNYGSAWPQSSVAVPKVWWAGATPAASGDTYLTFPVTLAEFDTGADPVPVHLIGSGL